MVVSRLEKEKGAAAFVLLHQDPGVMVVLHYSHLIDGVLSLDLDIHGDKEGKEEEYL